MQKSIISITAITLLAAMIILSVLGGGGLDIIMSTAPLHNALRALLIGGLLVLVLTVRPRPKIVRAGLGLTALTTIVLTVSQTMAYSLQLLDILMYTAVAIVLMVEAVEDDVVVEAPKRAEKIGAA